MTSETSAEMGAPRTKRSLPTRRPTVTVEPKVDQQALSRTELRRIVLSILG